MKLKLLFLVGFLSVIFCGFGQSYSDNREKFVKEFQKALASRFEARCDAQKGITSKEFDFGD